MKEQTFKVLGHEVVYTVAESSVEFNKLDPKRPDAACAEANNNIVYRGMNPYTRDWFLHGFDLTDDDVKKLITANPSVTYTPYEGVESEIETLLKDEVLAEGETPSRKTVPAKNAKGEVRTKDGVEVTKYNESQEVFYNRVLALAVKYKKFGSEDLARDHFDPIIKRLASYVPFDVTEREVGERGPKKLAGRYKIAAAKALSIGSVEKLNKHFTTSINKVFVPTNDTSKLFTGKYPTKAADGTESQVDFSVSDKDAEDLGWKIKEYQDWKSSQELAQLTD